MTIGPLVSTEWLAGHLDHSRLRLADCRWYLDNPAAGTAAYRDGHIPGAVYMSLDDDLSGAEGPGRHPLPTRDSFAETLGAAGIGNSSVVVAYDDSGGAFAARLWWMMRWMGHESVAVLDGGIIAWDADDGPISTLLPSIESADYALVDKSMPTIARDALGRRLGATTLMDARDGARYRGEVEPIDPVAGHIPSAVSAPYADNLDASGRFKDAGVLRERFTDLGATDGGETVVYCGSGVTACHDILAMEVAGLPTATLYPGSWSDWSSDPNSSKVTGG